MKKGKLTWNELEELREWPRSIWINSDCTTQGHYDCISRVQAATLCDSLLLIKTKDFIVEVGSKVWDGVRTRIYRGKFDHKGTYDNLSVTDPVARDVFKAKKEGDYPLKDVYLCISLTEPYKEDGRCHKLVAAIIGIPPLRA